MRARATVMLLTAAVAAGCDIGGDGSAPDPGGDEQARVSLPPPRGKLFGFNTALSLWAISPAREVALERRLGANAQRYGVPWRGVQPAPGAALFSGGQVARLDALYRELTRARMVPIITLGDAPLWAAGCPPTNPACLRQERSVPPAADQLRGWAAYAAAVARRYPRAVLEVWNEANLRIFWRAPRLEPARMARLQCSAYRAVKGVSRSRTVLSPGFAITATTSAQGDPPFAQYAARFFRAGGGRCIDGLSAHVYGGNEPSIGRGTTFAREMEALRGVRRRHGVREPVWVTETGGTSVPGQLDEAQQGDLNLRLYDRLMTTPGVKAVLFNTLRDARDPGLVGRRGEPNYHYGFLAEDFRPKPAFCAFAARARTEARGCGG